MRWNGSGFEAPEAMWKYPGSPAGAGVGRRGEDGVDDEVDRDDVEDRVGQPGEVRQLPAAVGEDQRIGDLEAVDPAGEGCRSALSMIAGRTTESRCPASPQRSSAARSASAFVRV